jgi:F-type H+-transporting ATPase subunit delta
MTQHTRARRYAHALLDVALAEADPQQVEQELAELTELFTGHAALWAVVTNPALPVTAKRGIVDAVLAKTTTGPVLQKLLRLLAGRDRLGLLPDIVETYGDRLLDHQRVVRADIRSAVPLGDGQAQRLEQELSARTGRRVVMTTKVDAALLGGVVAQIGSTVYDGSIRRQLEKLREQLA